MRWLIVFAAACASAPPRPHREPPQPRLATARIAVDKDRWLDVTLDGWHALDRCDLVVGDQLDRFGLARDHVARACDAAGLPRLPSAYQLVTIDRDIFSSTPPNGLKTIETIETLDSLDACEARKAQLDAQEAQIFEQNAMQRRRAMDRRIDAVKRECDEARAEGIQYDPSCFCEVVQVPSPTFTPTPRSCRASH